MHGMFVNKHLKCSWIDSFILFWKYSLYGSVVCEHSNSTHVKFRKIAIKNMSSSLALAKIHEPFKLEGKWIVKFFLTNDPPHIYRTCHKPLKFTIQPFQIDFSLSQFIFWWWKYYFYLIANLSVHVINCASLNHISLWSVE